MLGVLAGLSWACREQEVVKGAAEEWSSQKGSAKGLDSISVELGPKWAESGPLLADCSRQPQLWPIWARLRPDCGRIRPGFGHVWATSIGLGPTLARSACARRISTPKTVPCTRPRRRLPFRRLPWLALTRPPGPWPHRKTLTTLHRPGMSPRSRLSPHCHGSSLWGRTTPTPTVAARGRRPRTVRFLV